MYEWLCGDRPFYGSFTELCTQHMFASPPPLHEKLSGLLPDVEQVVMTALAKDPKARFGSVHAFAHALEQASLSTRLHFFLPVGLIGFIVGLALLKTKGRYDNFRSITLVEGLSTIAIVVQLSVMLSILGFIERRNGFPFSLLVYDFLQVFPYTLPGLILLPILLFIYGKIVNRKNGVI